MAGCGECTVCCTTMAVEEIRKPPGVACGHLCDKGCSIYEMRPASCREFECVWLQSQATSAPLPKRLRPDRCGVMLAATTHESTMAAHCNHPAALTAYPIRGYIKRWLSNGIRIVKIAGNERTLIAKVKR